MGRKLELPVGSVEELRQETLGDVKALSLDGNTDVCGALQAAALARLLAETPRLQELSLVGCSVDAGGMQALAPGLQRVQELERLDLSGNRFGAEGAIALADEALQRLPALRELSLARCRLGAVAARRLAGGLRRLRALEALHLGGNEFGEEGMRDLVEDALPSLPGLRRLSLAGFVRMDVAIAAQLAAGLAHLPALVDLDLSTCGLVSESLAVLAPGLQALSQMQRLNLRHSNLRLQGARTLADAVLPKLPGLLELDVARCELDASAVVELSLGLLHLQKLERLLLEGNEFGTDGSRALATAAFPHLTALRELDVSECGLDIPATKELAPAFKHVKGLRVLRYRGNHFGTEGATVLSAEALVHLVELEIFDVRRCDLTRPAIEALGPGASRLPRLEVLDFGEHKAMGQYVRGLSFGKEEWAPKPQKFKSLDLEGSGLGASFLAKTIASFKYLGEVETLNFKGNDFGGNFVEVLATDGLPHLPRLRDLNLTDCSISAAAMQVLASHVGNLPNLERISLRGNEFGVEGSKALAEVAFPRMQKLKELIFAHCDLDAAAVQALAPGLAHLTGLEKLVVAFNEFEEEGLEALSAQAFPRLVAMRELNLCSCGLEGPQVAKHLAPALAHMPALEKLVLTSNELGDEGAKGLGEKAFPALLALKELELAHCAIDASAAQELVPGLRCLANLRKLTLTGNKLAIDGARALAQEALPHIRGLTELNLAYGGLDVEAIKLLAPALKDLQALEILQIRNNKFEEKGAEVLAAEVLPHLRRLEQLDVRLTGVREATMEAFAAGLACSSRLRMLELGDKRLLIAFVSALPRCNSVNLGSLQELALDKCDLNGDFMAELAPGIRLLTSLEVLSLRANEAFGLEGSRVLAGVLPRLAKLRELHLSQCGILGDGMLELAPSISQLLDLEILNVMNNNLGDEGAMALIKTVMPRLLQLREMNVMGCGFSEEVKDAVGAARSPGSGIVG